jgi:hypothetical protein
MYNISDEKFLNIFHIETLVSCEIFFVNLILNFKAESVLFTLFYVFFLLFLSDVFFYHPSLAEISFSSVFFLSIDIVYKVEDEFDIYVKVCISPNMHS